MELKCAVQKYEWGKIGADSKVATLCRNADKDFQIEPNTPYAELWMGTHPSGPSRVKCNDESLARIIGEHPEVLGDKSLQHFGPILPFLFKVLSIEKALSIQAHPNKAHAEELHSTRPDLYKDPNHKPELAIALTPFEALCGFRPVEEIKAFIKDVPELATVIGNDVIRNFVDVDYDKEMSKENFEEKIISNCFKALMICPQDTITKQLKSILKRFSSLEEGQRQKQLAPTVERLYSQFPEDVGCFSIYFLNIVNLNPFEALYLGPNEPHAYLYGDCVECMACSDNVVRAGLTPKFKDVETLCEMLVYKGEPAKSKLFRPEVEDKNSVVFRPPVPDFAVAKIELDGKEAYKLIPRESASILLVVEGCGVVEEVGKTLDLVPGSVVFVKASASYEIRSGADKLLIFQAMANV